LFLNCRKEMLCVIHYPFSTSGRSDNHCI
jgi:hypothetical protein